MGQFNFLGCHPFSLKNYFLFQASWSTSPEVYLIHMVNCGFVKQRFIVEHSLRHDKCRAGEAHVVV